LRGFIYSDNPPVALRGKTRDVVDSDIRAIWVSKFFDTLLRYGRQKLAHRQKWRCASSLVLLDDVINVFLTA